MQKLILIARIKKTKIEMDYIENPILTEANVKKTRSETVNELNAEKQK